MKQEKDEKRKYSRYFEFLEWFDLELRTLKNARIEESVIHWETGDGGKGSCLLPIILRQENWTSLEDLRRTLDNPFRYGIILMQAGRASIAVAEEDEILYSKQIQKYMVRKSQGKSQLSYLNEKGKSRLGSRIRLRQSQEFFEDIDAKLKELCREHDLKYLFLSCTPKLKGHWHQATGGAAVDRKDSRWRRIPFMLHSPSQDETQRMHRLLCRVSWQIC
ncbi:MAG: hypothetical protein EOP07_01355 [Proteobacteria bacterium]|nr:MAG: hypothetical protein EOP07_01355 [Pseudomonadota bacterium]